MRLPALEARERAYLQASQPNAAVGVFAGRLRQHLVASLGVAASVGESGGGDAQEGHAGEEPAIAIAPELAAAWLALRLGGRPGSSGSTARDDRLIWPLKALIRRALAESVVNSGIAAWPRRMRLDVALGGQPGAVEISWDSAHAMSWARRTIREKT